MSPTTFEPVLGSTESIERHLQNPFSLSLSKALHRLGRGAALFVLVFAFYFLFSHYLLQSVRVVGSSMMPTLHDSNSYLLNRWIYLLREPHRTDVVVLRDPSDGGLSVKRVVATGGDTVHIKDGVLYVNGSIPREDYLRPMTPTFGEKQDMTYKCQQDELFVLGDNRNNSIDSRVYGPVPRKNILGMIVP